MRRLFQKGQPLLVALLFLGIGLIASLGVRQYRRDRRELAAQQAIWPAEIYLREGNYEMALEGGGGDMGVLEIIDKFEHTKAGNLAHFYAAIAYLNKKARDEAAAIEHLQAFQGTDSFMQARVWGLLGDLHCDQKAYTTAIEYYEKAAAHMPNPFTSPAYLFSAALAYEELQEYEQARSCYERVYTLFPTCEAAHAAIKEESRLKQLAQSKPQSHTT